MCSGHVNECQSSGTDTGHSFHGWTGHSWRAGTKWSPLFDQQVLPQDFHVRSSVYGLPMAQWVKNPPAKVGDIRDAGWIPGLGRSPGGGRGNPLQDFCLENPHGPCGVGATVHRVAESDTTAGLSSTHDSAYCWCSVRLLGFKSLCFSGPHLRRQSESP